VGLSICCWPQGFGKCQPQRPEGLESQALPSCVLGEGKLLSGLLETSQVLL
jgi:hypothetical protein